MNYMPRSVAAPGGKSFILWINLRSDNLRHSLHMRRHLRLRIPLLKVRGHPQRNDQSANNHCLFPRLVIKEWRQFELMLTSLENLRPNVASAGPGTVPLRRNVREMQMRLKISHAVQYLNSRPGHPPWRICGMLHIAPLRTALYLCWPAAVSARHIGAEAFRPLQMGGVAAWLIASSSVTFRRGI